MKKDEYSDRIDKSHIISLYEYGFVRNPKTNEVIVFKPTIRTMFIDFNTIKGALIEADEGYFNFIGSTKEEELAELDNNNLAFHISSLDQYYGLI